MTVAIDNVKKSTIPISSGNTLYVGGSGEGNYTKIQGAIDYAKNGDTVFVFNGTYYENVIVGKSINLIGENRNTTIIDGKLRNDVVNIFVDWVNISRFTIQYGDNTGIDISSDHITIAENNILNNWYFGIYSYRSNYIRIINNAFLDNYASGIDLGLTNYTIIENNIFSNNGRGINLNSLSSYNNIADNNISKNMAGLSISHLCNNNNITGNIISNNTDGGMTLFFPSNNNFITGNHITSNGFWGIGARSYNNTITNNNISNNKFGGLYFIDSYSNIISENNIMNNDLNGLDFHGSCNNTITNNNFSFNKGTGILLNYSSSKNILYHNNFINNIQNANDTGNNIWDDGKYGNYWSDYEEKCPDAKKLPFKGIWDTPYEIEGGDNKDKCPLIHQWPKSRTRTSLKTTTTIHPIVYWLLERFPMLERLLSLLL